MIAKPALVESLESRTLMCASLGEGVSELATSQPHATATLVHVTQAADGTAFGQVVADTAHNPSTFPGCND